MDEGCRQLDGIFFRRHQGAAGSRRLVSHLTDIVAAVLVMVFIADGTGDGKTGILKVRSKEAGLPKADTARTGCPSGRNSPAPSLRPSCQAAKDRQRDGLWMAMATGACQLYCRS